MLRKVDRILLRVPQIESAVRYYRQTLGLKLLKQQPAIGDADCVERAAERLLVRRRSDAAQRLARLENSLEPGTDAGAPGDSFAKSAIGATEQIKAATGVDLAGIARKLGGGTS